jgi:hypothetical protein
LTISVWYCKYVFRLKHSERKKYKVEVEKVGPKMMKRIRLGFLVVATVCAQHAFADAAQAPPTAVAKQFGDQTVEANQAPAPSINDMASPTPSESAAADSSQFTSEKCIIDKNDQYDIGEVMRAGVYKAQCMDISVKRPAIILSEDDSKITIANFYHEGTFWIAEMPKSGVDQVIFQIADFPDPVPLISFAHTQLRFIMKPGMSIKLTPQDTGSKLAPTEIDQVNLVDQVSGPKNEDDFIASKGLGPTYGNILRVMGSMDRAKEELGSFDKKTGKSEDLTRQYLLKMTDQEKDTALVNGIRLSAKLGYSDIYHLFKENCTTTAFAILDDSIKYPHHVGKFKIHPWEILDPIAGPSLSALRKRKLIDKEIETWNEETGLR